MNVVILYQPKSEHSRHVEEYEHEFKRLYPESNLELIDADSIPGSAKAEVYDVVQYPTVLAMSNDGHLQQQWAGDQLPLMNELVYYTRA